jgi:hypothetical protein
MAAWRLPFSNLPEIPVRKHFCFSIPDQGKHAERKDRQNLNSFFDSVRGEPLMR